MKKKTLFVLMCILGVLAAAAFDTTGYVVATNSGSKEYGPLCTPSDWLWPSGTTPEEMDADAKYYSNLETFYAYLRNVEGDFTTPGTEFVLERNVAGGYGSIRVSSTYMNVLTFNNLIVHDCTRIVSWSFSATPISGAITVQSSKEEPFLIHMDANTGSENNCFILTNLTISAGADYAMKVIGPSLSDRSTFSKCSFRFVNCNMTNFLGRLSVGMFADPPASNDIRAVFRPTDLAISGELVCEAGGAISMEDVPNAIVVGGLTLEDGAVIQKVHSGATLMVTNSLSVTGTVYLDLSSLETSTDKSELAVLTCLPEVDVSDVDVSSFQITNAANRLNLPFDLSSDLVWETIGGTNILKIVMPEIVLRESVEPNDTYRDLMCAENASGDDFWSNGGCPATDTDASNTIYYCEGYRKIRPGDMSGGTYQFPGRALVVCGNTLISYSGANDSGVDFDIIAIGPFKYSQNKVNLKQGFYDPISSAELLSYTFGGTCNLLSSSSIYSFYVTYNMCLLVDSTISGVGTIHLRGWITGNPSVRSVNVGVVEFSGDNSDYGGKIKVSEDYYTSQESLQGPDADYHMRFIVSNGKALGGKCSEFAYDALYLDHYSSFEVRDDVTLATNLNRGVAIGDYASFWVPESKTLTVNQPIDLCGSLTKSGAGTLVLGGSAMTFGEEGTAELPTADSNIVTVAEGYLRVTSADAADGAAITLASGTKLLVGTNDTAATSLRCVKTGSSLAAADGSIPVAFDVGDADAHKFTTVICTSSDSELSFTCSNPWQGWGAFVRSETADGVTTYTASVDKSGLLIMFR